MPKYLVLWRVKTEEIPDDPNEMERIMGMLMSNVAKDFKEGTTLDWGLFLDGQYGYGIRQMDALDLQKFFMIVSPYLEVLSIQEAINFEDAQKNVHAVVESMKAMQK